MLQHRGRDVFLFVLLAAALWLPASCAGRDAAVDPLVPAAAETAYPVTEAAQPAVASTEIPATDVPAGKIPAAEASDTPAPVQAAVAGDLPRIVRRSRLVNSPDYLRDFRFDARTNRYFVSTSNGQLLVLDAETLEPAARFGMGGDLTLDEANRRLYVAPGSDYVPEGQAPVIHVLDVDTLEEVGAIEGRRVLALDVPGGRIFAGSPARPYPNQNDLPGVGIYDLATLTPRGEIEQSGVPTYNSLRDELLITAYTVYVVDPESGAILQDLMPELQEQPFAWCNGCEMAAGAYLFEEEGLLVIQGSTIRTGAGPGFEPEPLYFDAATLEPVTEFSRRWPMQFMCGSRPLLLPPIADTLYDQSFFIRYVVYRNFDAKDLAGSVLTWRDGLFAPYINPRTRQAYVTQGYVLDLHSLTPVGRLPAFCPLEVDEEQGRIYGRADGDLLVIDETGGAPMAPLPSEPDTLPATGVAAIYVSPGYPQDPTVFALLDNGRVYRTVDDGQSWVWLQGGLPVHDSLTLTLALSPDFAQDRTLFAGGFVGDYQGEGVLRSTDAGDTWEAMWKGLDFLRVYDLVVSPDYATEGRIQASAYYHRLAPWDSGVGLLESTDRGLSWTLVMTAAEQSALHEQAVSLAASAPDLPVRLAGYGQTLEVQDAAGQAWTAVDLGRQENELFRAVVPSPSYAADGTIYVLGEYGLWRTADRGVTWARWADPRLDDRDQANALSTLAISPALPDGSHKLFVGSYGGNFWVLAPAPGGAASPAPTLTSTTTAGAASSAMVTATAAISATSTPMPTPIGASPLRTPAPPLPEEPPAGAYRPLGPLATLWDSSDQTQRDLGYALQETAANVPAAYQSFEHGGMIWRGDTAEILVLFDDGTWQAYPDTFEEGEAESDPALRAPAGTQQPLRGFGKLWRSDKALQDRLEWALDKEQGYTAFIQEFERGFLLGSPIGARVMVAETKTGGRWY